MRRLAPPLVMLVLASHLSMAQQTQATADSVRYARLSAVGRLWATVKLFHPYIAYRLIDWDTALVAAIPAVNAARTPTEYQVAVQSMLARLGDPVTRVETTVPAGQPDASPQPAWSWTTDSVLVVRATNYADFDDFGAAIGRFDSIAGLVGASHGVVIDLRRRVRAAETGNLFYALSQSRLLRRFITDTLAGPGQRTRMHSGYHGDVPGRGSEFYYSAWQVRDGERYLPNPGSVGKPLAFVVNAGSELPVAALALLAGGKAAVVSEGPGSDAAIVDTRTLDLGDSVQVTVRLSEPVYRDGSGSLPPDSAVAATADSEAAIQAALALVRAPFARRALTGAPLAVTGPLPERDYAALSYPPLGYRLLAAFRIWSTMEYFHAYRQLYDEDWNAVLLRSLPALEAAKDSLEYALAVAEMVTHIHDSHGFIGGAALRGFLGQAGPPIDVRMIERQPVVAAFVDDSAARAAGVRLGDVIVSVDGVPAATRLARYARYRAASTPQHLGYQTAQLLLSGPDSSVAQVVVRGVGGVQRTIRLPRSSRWPDCYGCRKEAILRMLPGNIGYADLDRLPASMVDSMFEMFKGTRAIIFDMRGYPQGTAWPIAPRLTDRRHVVAARFVRPLAFEPHPASGVEGEEDRETMQFTQELPPTDKWRYHGRTVMLIDERTISQAEHTGLFFEAANHTVFIGSPTTGANGDVTLLVVPGGLRIGFSGHDVRHADGRQLQRLGLTPTVTVYPTIAGIRAGRDEVLERALAYLRRP